MRKAISMQIQFYPRSGIDASNLKLGIKFLSRFENRIIGNSRASVVSRLFIFLLFFFSLSRDQSKTARRGKEGEEILD